MFTFLNVPFLDTNRTYQMFAHYSCVEQYIAGIGYKFDAKMN